MKPRMKYVYACRILIFSVHSFPANNHIRVNIENELYNFFFLLKYVDRFILFGLV